MLHLAQGNRLLSLFFLTWMGSCDILDGLLARRTKRSTPFGAFLDSTLDRLTEGLVFLGILLFFHRQGDGIGLTLTTAVLIGSYLVSYTRARGENFLKSCKVGFWERPERLCLLMLAVWIGRLKPALCLLAIGSFLTSLHRLLHVQATLQKKTLPRKGLWSLLFWSYERFSTPYLLYAVVAALLVLLIK